LRHITWHIYVYGAKTACHKTHVVWIAAAIQIQAQDAGSTHMVLAVACNACNGIREIDITHSAN